MVDYSLSHWGIKGQKWGVRRFQNEDGTYTQEGLARRREKFPDDIRRQVNELNDIDAAINESKYDTKRLKLNAAGRAISRENTRILEKHRDEIVNAITKSGEYQLTSRPVIRLSKEGKLAAVKLLGTVAMGFAIRGLGRSILNDIIAANWRPPQLFDV